MAFLRVLEDTACHAGFFKALARLCILAEAGFAHCAKTSFNMQFSPFLDQ